MQPKPIASKSSRDKFADVRPLLVVVGDGFICGGGTVQDGSALPRHGNATSYLEPGNDIFIPSVVQFYSLKSQSYVHVLKFRSVVYSVRCSSRVVAISQAAQPRGGTFHSSGKDLVQRKVKIPIFRICLPPAAPLNENEGGTRTKTIKKENSDGNHSDTSSCSDADQPQHVRRSTVKAKEAPNFAITLQHHNFKLFSMNIPIAFARSNGLVGSNSKVTLKNEKGKCWQVTTVTYKKSSGQLRVYIRNGWREFLDANKLSTGDVCTFDLLSTGENVVMEVTIKKHKKSKISNRTKKKATLYKDLDSFDVSSTPRLHVKRDMEEVRCFTTEIKMTNFSLNCMNIPLPFARSNGLTNRVCMITLKNTLGRCWQVNLRYKQRSGNVYIRSGWRKFSDDNEFD